MKIGENTVNRYKIQYSMMNKVFMESRYCTDGTLATAIEGFLLDAGVKQEHIDAYKRIMLG